jgi:hypothetical protein
MECKLVSYLRARRPSTLEAVLAGYLLLNGCASDDRDDSSTAGSAAMGGAGGAAAAGGGVGGSGGIPISGGMSGGAGVAGVNAGAGAGGSGGSGGFGGAGSGGAMSGGSGGSQPVPDAGTQDAGMQDVCGAIPVGAPLAATPKAVVLHGLVEYHTDEVNEFLGVHATLIVPAEPPPSGVIFAWPGTQALPDSPTFDPVGAGVLQPVLTWGSSCVPGSLPGHSTWWISPVYVNEGSGIAELNGCHGGPVITVDVGDRLDLDMRLDGTNWDQKVIDLDTDESTTFRIDLRGQQQQRALFWIELKTAAKPTEDIIFEDIVLTMRDPEPGACALNNAGMNDYVSEARVSADGLHCCIDRVVLRAEGVPATTEDP